jgi:glycosyltransferase involved in cell wall biosynthesis
VRGFWEQQASPALKDQGLARFYDLGRIKEAKTGGLPSLMIGLYAFASGGGEVMTIRLANALYGKGFSVTVFEFEPAERNPEVRRMLNSAIPVVTGQDTETLRRYIRDFGIDIFNSHHPGLQNLFCHAFPDDSRPIHVGATHGLYDTMKRGQLSKRLVPIDARTDKWVYVADKNLVPFESLGLYDKERFLKLPNGMERPQISKVPRSELGIPDDAFVLCLVSRAVAEKGWREAIEVVSVARTQSERDIHLLLIGDGEEYAALEAERLPGHVHLLGFRPDPWNYYATSDMGFLPSVFSGESFPLVIIEALFAGKPVIASDVGEIRQMLDGGGGELAGAVFPLEGGRVPIGRVAERVCGFASDRAALGRATELARKNSIRFEMDAVAVSYRALFSALA